jgi:hypothetical protein
VANSLYRQPYYFDANALRAELKRHHPVSQKKADDGTVTITCSCGADTGMCSSSDLAVEIFTAHLENYLAPPLAK